MKRREFITLLGGAAAAWPVAARAQQPAVPVVGYLNILSFAQNTHVIDAFRRGLGEAGYIEGQNVAIERRWADGKIDRLPSLVADLTARHAAVIAAAGGIAAAQAVKVGAATTPFVFMMGDVDPVEAGLVASLSRPMGNMTGISLLGGALGTKRLEILRELAPKAASIAVLVNPNNQNAASDAREVEAAVRATGQRAVVLPASAVDHFDAAFATLVRERADALIVTADGIFTNGRERLIGLAMGHRIPTIYQWREFVAAGGLISYGASLADASRQVGTYVGRILKGAKPSDLPVMQPTKFDLVINLNTARALGLTVPPSLLARADEVIE
jgi:putative tryptophan/tyrosine transport system substrate-binding protein